MTEEIPQWAFDRACELTNIDGSSYDSKDPRFRAPDVGAYSIGKAFARYIAQHEQPPVDPDLVKAREICARAAKAVGQANNPMRYRAGDYDDDPEVQFALSALKEACNA